MKQPAVPGTKPGNLSFLFRCGISIGLLFFVCTRLDWPETVFVLKGLDFRWAAGGSLLAPVLIFLLSVRWRLFLEKQGLKVPFRNVFWLTWTGQFFNSVLPGSTGGDVYKIFQLCRLNPGRKMASAATVIADRFSALIALAFLLGFFCFLGPRIFWTALEKMGSWNFGLTAVLVIGVGCLVAIGVLVFAFRSNARKEKIREGFRVFRGTFGLNRIFAKALFYSLTIHCISFLGFFIMARALGISISFLQVLTILPVVLFVVLLPVTVNGHGVREVMLIFFFQTMDIGWIGSGGVAETVVALSIVMVINDLLWNLPPGLAYILSADAGGKAGLGIESPTDGGRMP